MTLLTGYDDKAKRMLIKANLTPVKDASELEALIEKTRAKIEKAKSVGGINSKEETKGTKCHNNFLLYFKRFMHIIYRPS